MSRLCSCRNANAVLYLFIYIYIKWKNSGYGTVYIRYHLKYTHIAMGIFKFCYALFRKNIFSEHTVLQSKQAISLFAFWKRITSWKLVE